MNAEAKPRALIVYYTLTKQAGRVADAMAIALESTRLRCHEGHDRVHRRAVRAKALAVPDEAPHDPDPGHPAGAAPPQDRGDRHPAGGAGGRVRLGTHRVSDLVVPDEHADPVISRVTGGEGHPRRQAIRVRVDLPPLLRDQPRAAGRSSARRTAGGWIDKTHFVWPAARSSRCSRGSGYMKHGEPQERVFGLKM